MKCRDYDVLTDQQITDEYSAGTSAIRFALIATMFFSAVALIGPYPIPMISAVMIGGFCLPLAFLGSRNRDRARKWMVEASGSILAWENRGFERKQE